MKKNGNPPLIFFVIGFLLIVTPIIAVYWGDAMTEQSLLRDTKVARGILDSVRQSYRPQYGSQKEFMIKSLIAKGFTKEENMIFLDRSSVDTGYVLKYRHYEGPLREGGVYAHLSFDVTNDSLVSSYIDNYLRGRYVM